MKMTIGKRIIGGFLVVVGISAALGVFAYTRVTAMDSQIKVLSEESLPGALNSGKIESLTRRAMVLALRHVLNEDKQAKDKAEADILKNTEELDATYKKYGDGITQEEDRRLFAALDGVRAEFRRVRTEVLNLSRTQKTKEATALVEEKLDPAYQAYVDKVAALTDFNKRYADQVAAAAKSVASTARVGIIIAIAAVLTLAITIALLITRGVSKVLTQIVATLREGSEQVSSASAQVSAASQSLAEGTTEQAAGLEETSSSLEEMSSMTKQNADNAEQANTLAVEAKKAAGTGSDSMGRMNAAILEIQKSSDETAKIIKVIDEIAFQTNLLALNAAVEAARAGEAGKGFAVVAEEVRNLAMRSAEAAKNTARMIEESVKNSKNGVDIATEVSKVLEEIVQSVGKTTDLVSEIAAASQEQAKGIDQVNTAVSQMDKVTQQNAANAEESASASEELSAQAESMTEVVSQLVALVGGRPPSRPGRGIEEDRAPPPRGPGAQGSQGREGQGPDLRQVG